MTMIGYNNVYVSQPFQVTGDPQRDGYPLLGDLRLAQVTLPVTPSGNLAPAVPERWFPRSPR
jgi:hypothetical protein